VTLRRRSSPNNSRSGEHQPLAVLGSGAAATLTDQCASEGQRYRAREADQAERGKPQRVTGAQHEGDQRRDEQ
jgi:hypothetical protein